MKVIDIILKDLKVLLTDKKTIGIMILMPVIITTILGAALSNMFSIDENKEQITIAVVKEYDYGKEVDLFINTLQSEQFSQNMNGSQMMNITEQIMKFNMEEMFFKNFLENEDIKGILNYKVIEKEEAKSLLDQNKISSIVILPDKFIYDMYMNFSTPFRNEIYIEVIGGSANYIHNQIVEGIMKGFSEKVSSLIIGKNVYLQIGTAEGIDMSTLFSYKNVIDDISKTLESANITLKTEKVNRKKPLSSFQFYAAAMTAMYILFTAGEGGKLLLEEKENLTYQRMAVAGVSKNKVVLGKYFTIFSFALLQITIMIAYSSLVLGVDWGNSILVSIITLCAAFAIAGLGTMLSAISYSCGSYKMADVFQSIIVFMLSLFGGSFMPIEVLPRIFKKTSNFIPNGVALKAYKNVMLGNGIKEILTSLLVLIAMGVIMTLISIYILKREEGWKNVKYNFAETSKIEG